MVRVVEREKLYGLKAQACLELSVSTSSYADDVNQARAFELIPLSYSRCFVSLSEARKKDKGGGYLMMSALMMGE